MEHLSIFITVIFRPRNFDRSWSDFNKTLHFLSTRICVQHNSRLNNDFCESRANIKLKIDNMNYSYKCNIGVFECYYHLDFFAGQNFTVRWHKRSHSSHK